MRLEDVNRRLTLIANVGVFLEGLSQNAKLAQLIYRSEVYFDV